MKTRKTIVFAVLALLVLGAVVAYAAPPLSGAIFTTTVDGDIVNENVHYEAKEDVYLDGGPGPNAPSSAAGLPEGDYYFQVTDPSGKDLLSTDHISCRKIHVNEFGVIDFVYAGTNYEKDKGSWVPVDCQHAQGVDVDHSELGAITVQLFPYDDTPNPGGVYKAWITPVDDYACDDGYVPDKMNDPVNNEGCSQFHGFIPAASKTDNYKVKKKGKPFEPPVITVRKFHDANLNCMQDAGEEDITGWEVYITDPLGVTNTEFTEVTVDASEPGTYMVEEETPNGTVQTVSLLDGAQDTCYPNADPVVDVEVAGDSEETHEVVYGNVGLADVTVCKVYDANADGVADESEPPISGWPMTLNGTAVTGETIGPIVQLTEEDGCTTFSDLLPGTYMVTEAVPTGWYASGPVSVDCSVDSSVSGSDISGSASCTDPAGGPFNGNFTNYCINTADFGTKGYWHNKNGLSEIVEDFVTGYVNTLDPYDDPTSYFDNGDEPFDGFFEDGTPVDAAFNNDDLSGEVSAQAGTVKAEVSHFLVDPNAGGDPREQLAQQLLAFIFNTEYRLGGDGSIQLPDGSFVLASDLIAQAITAWQGSDPAAQTAIKDILDGFNNSDAVPFIPGDPAFCPAVTP